MFHDFSAEVFGLDVATTSRPDFPTAVAVATEMSSDAPATFASVAARAPVTPADPAPAPATDRASVDIAAGDEAPTPNVSKAFSFPEPDAGAIEAVSTSLGGIAARRHLDADDFTGNGKAVVVIDTGWSPWYDQSNTVHSFDFHGRNDRNASVDTPYSHGSWVAQTVTNVAANVDIIHLKVFDDAGDYATMKDVEQALKWTVRNAEKYDIAAVNLSLGYGNATRLTRTQLSDEFKQLDDKGVLSIVAAGNDGETYAQGVNVIAASPHVVAVSATTAADRFTSWTQKHKSLTDISAIGENVEVETIYGGRGHVSGTSFAAPYVAGAVARLQEAVEEVFGVGAALDDREVLGILRASGDRVKGAPASWKGAVEADADAAVDWFLDHAAAYADAVWA